MIARLLGAAVLGGVVGKNIVLGPSRIAAQVVSGVGFLGADTILSRGEAVKVSVGVGYSPHRGSESSPVPRRRRPA